MAIGEVMVMVALTCPTVPLNEQLLIVRLPVPAGMDLLSDMSEEALFNSSQNSLCVAGLGMLVSVTGGKFAPMAVTTKVSV